MKMSTFFSIKLKKCEDMFDWCGLQMSIGGFFDSLTIRVERQNAKKYLTLRYVVKTRFIPPKKGVKSTFDSCL